MKTIAHSLATTLGLTMLSAVFPTTASAGCGAGFDFHRILAPNLNLLAAQESDSEARHSHSASIVGMWKAVFTSRGTSTVPGGTLPPDTPFEYGFQHWHSDGTEFFNSGDRAPTTQNFCMGVYEQTGPRTYKLNHFAYNYDALTSQLIGKVNIREQVTVGGGGNKYTGTFTIQNWDMNGNQIVNIAGTLEGARVTVDTVDTTIP